MFVQQAAKPVTNPRKQGSFSTQHTALGAEQAVLELPGWDPFQDWGDLLTISIRPSFIRIRALTRKANMSLCFSKRLRHTLQ